MRRLLGSVRIGCALGVLATAAAVAQDYPWKPDRPVTLIVPWAAGGSTDQMARIVASEVESELGQKMVVVNQPGASGSVGTKGVLEGTKDGYTWAAGAAVDIGGYKVLGLLDSQLKDWNMFFAVANVASLAANPNSGITDFGKFLETLKTKGATTPVATAGLSSAGHNYMESIKKAAKGVEYRHVTYDGGNPAVLSTVSGETQAVAQLLVEMSEMIKGKRLVPLACCPKSRSRSRASVEIAPTTKWLRNAGPDELLRHLGNPRHTRQHGQDHEGGVEQEDQELRGPEEVRECAERPLGAIQRGGRAGVLQDGALVGLALFRRRQGEISPDTLGIQRL